MTKSKNRKNRNRNRNRNRGTGAGPQPASPPASPSPTLQDKDVEDTAAALASALSVAPRHSTPSLEPFLDDIIALAPPRSLLALRPVCKALRDRVDRILFSRLVLDSGVYTASGLKLRDGWRAASFARAVRTVDLCEPETSHLRRGDEPLCHTFGCDAHNVGHAGPHRMVKYGFEGPVRGGDTVRLSLRTLRLCGYTCATNRHVQLHARTVVAFVDMRPRTTDEWNMPPTAWVPDIPHTTELLVVNFLYEPRHQLTKYAALRLELPPGLEHIHLMVTPTPTTVAKPTLPSNIVFVDGPFRFLDTVFSDLVLSIYRGLRLTIIDPDSWDTDWVAGPTQVPPGFGRQERLGLAIVNAAFARFGVHSERAWSVAETVMWRTEDEYRLIFGNEAFELAKVM